MNATQQHKTEKKQPREIRRPLVHTKKRITSLWHNWRERTRISLRRAAHILHGALSVHRTVGPATFLSASAALGVALTLTTLYTTSYAVIVDGKNIGVVADRAVVLSAIDQVQQRGSQLLGYDYSVDSEVDYQFALTLKTDLTPPQAIGDVFYEQLDEVCDELKKCQVLVNRRPIGIVEDERALEQMLDELLNQYTTENTVDAEFVEDVSVKYVYIADEVLDIAQLRAALEENATGETTYTVQSGDTFNAIAYRNDMSVSDLKALNPQVDISRLSIGQQLNVKELIPVLSVRTTEHQVYTQQIECPVETQEDATIYKGSSKIIKQGREGEERVDASVTYVNGYERSREINETTLLREPTTTIKAIGTKEKPKTASTGTFSWPTRGKINSYFGGRKIFGSYSYHSGLDIQASTGTIIKAADGGKVTFAGYKGSYGNLVIITHDSGIQTYYAHNSALLVSAGQSVYKGQSIAKAGSTGRSTGPHCHFEVRVNGKAVNPLNYLK